MSQVDISFIIPAKNEERTIQQVVRSIRNAMDSVDKSYEVLVVDNQSTDQTAQLAQQEGAEVISCPPTDKIGAVRNEGAARAQGNLFVFVDGDVTLSDNWSQGFSALLEKSPTDKKFITGCEVSCPPASSWIEHIWFDVHGKDQSHINTAHLIIDSQLFDDLGGFDARLYTGEDYEFSLRARKKGVEILPDPSLKTFHHGYPKTLLDFFLRELWHGRGDFQSVAMFRSSKIAMASIAIVLAILLGAASGIVTGYWSILGISVVLLVAMALVAAVRRPKKKQSHLIAITFLYVVYFLARGLSILYVFSGRHSRTKKGSQQDTVSFL